MRQEVRPEGRPRRRERRSLRALPKSSAAALCLLPALVACGSDPAPDAPGTNAAAVANASAPAPAAAAEPVVLEGAGLRIPSASPPLSLTFGLPEAKTIGALTRAFGRPPDQLGDNPECGGGGMRFAEWKSELTAWFMDGNFAGWDNKGGLETLEGIGIGSRRADVAALPGFEAEESTLGMEFRAGGLSGILESGAPAAKVTHLWGGATCVFR